MSENLCPLSKLRPGSGGVVQALRCPRAIKRRLADLGMLPGTPVWVRRAAPFGDPIQVHLRGYELTLRKEDAQLIWMQPYA